MNERWAEGLRERAAAWWTPERTRSVLGDKQLLLHPAAAPELLRALGLIDAEARMAPGKVRKFRQINHMLGFLRPSLVELAGRFETVHIVDAGCGRSYLTMLVAWWFERIAEHPARILGVDRNPEVIATCRERAQTAGLTNLVFEATELADLDLAEHLPLHALISLHACDTATDDAIVLALRHDAAFIALAPCCQRELSRAWADAPDHPMSPVWGSPHLRHTTAATLTDTYRMLLLQAAGYDANATEFVEAVHTPKNTLIRAMRRGGPDGEARERYERLRDAMGGVAIGLEGRLA